MQFHILEICYLIASISFVVGLKMLGNPEKARAGNLFAAAGMALAIFATLLFYKQGVNITIYALIILAMVIGTVIGWVARSTSRIGIP